MYSVVDVLNHYSIYYESGSRSDLLFLCPFHEDTNLGSARINEETGEFHCFSCNASGNLYKFVMLMESCSFGDAKELIDNNFIPNKRDFNLLTEMVEKDEGNKKRQTVLFQKKFIEKENNVILNKLSLPNISEELFLKWLTICIYTQYDPISFDFYSSFFKDIANSNLDLKKT